MGGGGGSIDTGSLMRNWGEEWPKIRKGYRGQETQYDRFIGRDPILSRLYQGAASYFDQPTSPILGALQKQGLEYLQGGPSALTRIAQSQAEQDLLNRGRLTPALERDVRNRTLGTAGAMGMGYSPGTLGLHVLNAEAERERREGIARQYAGEAEGMRTADIASRFGIAGQTQGLTQADIAQRFAIPSNVLGTGVSAFSGLTNPILAYIGNLFSGNQQAGTQAALGNAQAAASNKSGQSGLAGAGIGAIGSIAGAVIL